MTEAKDTTETKSRTPVDPNPTPATPAGIPPSAADLFSCGNCGRTYNRTEQTENGWCNNCNPPVAAPAIGKPLAKELEEKAEGKELPPKHK